MQANSVMTNMPPATIEEIFKFLGQFEPRKCDFCGCNEWTVMLNAHGQPSVVDHNQYNIIKEGDAYVYIAFLHGTTEKCILVRCKKCGQVKQFSYSALMEWVINRRKQLEGPKA